MGCAASNSVGAPRRSKTGPTAELDGQSETSENAVFDAFDLMEQAEELDFIDQQQKQRHMQQLLMQRFPTRGLSMPSPRDAYSNWTSLLAAMPVEDDGFVLSAPYTLRKAAALYAYLKRPDAKPIPRRCVYEVLIAACKLFEQQTATSGALTKVQGCDKRALHAPPKDAIGCYMLTQA